MWFTIFVAFRNVFRQKKRSFTLGINYAVVTFVLVLLFAFSQGAIRNISSNVARASAGHVTVSGSYSLSGRVSLGVRRYADVIAAARRLFADDVTAVPRYSVRSMLYYNGLSKRVEFTGIDPRADAGLASQLQFAAGGWEQFAGAPNGVIMPADMAEYFGLGLDDEVVVAARTRLGAFNTTTLKVKGISRSGNFFAQGLLLCHFSAMQALDLAGADTASALYLYFRDATHLGQKRDALAASLRDAGFETNKPADATAALDAVSSASQTFAADAEGSDSIRLTLSTIDEAVGIVRIVTSAVNALGAVVALIMMFIIAVSIFINLRMTINERLREIGTMRAIGVGSGGITALFVLESTFLALLFSALGAAAALAAAALAMSVIRLPPTGAVALFLNNGRPVLIPRARDIAAVMAAVAAFAALFSYVPARRGGRIRPVEALTRVF